jgi:hypothetical protein
MTEYHTPPNEAKIERLYAFLDGEGRNGIIASILPGLGSIPLVTGSPRAAEFMKKLAQQVATETGKTVAMFAFARGEELWRSE